jgi:hypothetical protein
MADNKSDNKIKEDLKKYLDEAFIRIYSRKEKLGLIKEGSPGSNLEKQAKDDSEKFFAKVSEFVKNHQSMCRIWNSPELQKLRKKEALEYGVVHMMENNCIDGRIARAYKGEADVLQTEKAVIAVDKIQSDGEIIPRSPDVCSALADITKEPLVLALAHFDSVHTSHGCAAIDLALKDPQGVIEKFWGYLTPEERDLVFQARSRSLEEANLVLLKLTTSRAVTNHTNDVRAEYGLAPLQRVSIVALYDTRRMGIIIKAPIFNLKELANTVELASADRDFISTTDFVLELKSIQPSGFPRYGDFSKTFTEQESFIEFAENVVGIALTLNKGEYGFKEKVAKFISEHYEDLTKTQKNALIYRFFRTVAHQYLTGLAEAKEYHPFSEHEERYISASKDARFFGKYNVDSQCFIIHIPDKETGSKRINIGASVMDMTNIDKGSPHTLFITTSMRRDIFEAREKNKTIYTEYINLNKAFFREINTETAIIDRVSTENIVPIGLILEADTGEILQIVSENYRYL